MKNKKLKLFFQALFTLIVSNLIMLTEFSRSNPELFSFGSAIDQILVFLLTFGFYFSVIPIVIMLLIVNEILKIETQKGRVIGVVLINIVFVLIIYALLKFITSNLIMAG